jgi:Raf kinase inhibitor-like YbhB/YbcL family protein
MRLAITILLGLLLAAQTIHWPARATGAAPAPFTLNSPTFADGGPLPTSVEFNGSGCKGGNMPPVLTWSGVPKGTKSFALMIVDPDAAPFATAGAVHWVVYNIPGAVRMLGPATAGNYTQGMTVFGRPGFGGPCPPPNGEVHHYIFTLYALGVPQIAGKALTRDALLTAMTGHVLGGTSRVGTFKRP